MNARGLSLLELLVSLAIGGLILLFFLPFNQHILQKNRLEVMQAEIRQVIHFARTQAVLLNQPLALTPLPGREGDWSAGMLLFVDNKKHCYTHQDKLIYQWKWSRPEFHLSWNGFQSKDYLLFSPNLHSGAVNGYFLIQKNNHPEFKLKINRIGRIKIATV